MPCLDQGMAPAAIQAKLQPVPTWELSDLMPSCGRRLLGPGVLSQLELFELNVTENERRRETAGANKGKSEEINREYGSAEPFGAGEGARSTWSWGLNSK